MTFQFQTGAIKSKSASVLRCVVLLLFQFQTGAIKSEGGGSPYAVSNGFNSKLVRLKADKPPSFRARLTSFNSKLVRLKGDRPGAIDSPYAQSFQFQTGAIKSQQRFARRAELYLFQFQTGAIKRQEVEGLEPPPAWFQFQTGAIKRTRRMSSWRCVMRVSIPNWCD